MEQFIFEIPKTEKHRFLAKIKIKKKMKFFLSILTLTTLNFNLSAQSFSFNQGGFSEPDYFIELPYKNVKGKIIIEVKIENQLRKFILDTGAPTVIRKGLFENLRLGVLSSQGIESSLYNCTQTCSIFSSLNT